MRVSCLQQAHAVCVYKLIECLFHRVCGVVERSVRNDLDSVSFTEDGVTNRDLRTESVRVSQGFLLHLQTCEPEYSQCSENYHRKFVSRYAVFVAVLSTKRCTADLHGTGSTGCWFSAVPRLS